MRTTLDIDDDVLSAGKRAWARREQKTMGEVVTALPRQAQTAPIPSPMVVRVKRRRCTDTRRCRRVEGLVTNELIDQLRRDDAYSAGPMRALLDVNVPIALLDADDHASHRAARPWFAAHRRSRLGIVSDHPERKLNRIMSHLAYLNAQPAVGVPQRLRAATAPSGLISSGRTM